MKKNQQCPVVV